MQKIILFVLPILFITIVAGIYIYYRNILTPSPPLIGSQITDQLNPSSTPIPFYEITIPSLREREYKSNLAELTEYSDNGVYTTYLTSYTSDGLKINGLLTKPNQKETPPGGWPAIVFVHGYIPPNQYRTLEKYTDYIDFLARNGFVVFKIDLRGHGDSQGEPGGAYYSQDYVIDTLNAYSALQSSDFIGRSKIGLWGHSMAGNVVFRAMAVQPEIPAVVIWAGAGFSYLDLAEYGIQDASYQPPLNASPRNNRRQRLREIHGNPRLNHPFWDIMAATNFLNDLKGAIALHHAVDDEVVTVEYSRNLNNLLNQTSVKHQYHEYPSGGHNLTNGSFIQAMQRTVDFYTQNLKNK